MYTAEEKIEIDRILAAFQDYIIQEKNEDGKRRLEVLWSESLECYLMINNYDSTDNIKVQDLLIAPVESAEWLLTELVFEVANSVYHAYRFYDMPPEEITDAQFQEVLSVIASQLAPYLNTLPEYREQAMQIAVEHGELYKTNLSLDELVEYYTQKM